MTLSIIITTRNREIDLRRTLTALAALNPRPLEIIVTVDGCTNGTMQFLSALRKTKIIVNEKTCGSVASRDRMMREAAGELVLSLDDDSYPEQNDCLLNIIRLFQTRPKLAVLHFPQRSDEYKETLARRDFGLACLTRSFSNSGAVIRRSIYLEVGGFYCRFFHAYEEPDFALRCIAAGYEVLYYPGNTIRHHYSLEQRDELRTHHMHARNEFWSTWLRCPIAVAVVMSVFRFLSHARYAGRRGLHWLIREPVWWWAAVVGLPECLKERKPITQGYYIKWLRLGRRPTPIEPSQFVV